MAKRKSKTRKSRLTGRPAPAAIEVSGSRPSGPTAQPVNRPVVPPLASRAQAFIPLVIAALAAVAYSNSFSGPFIIDDKASIPENPHIRRLSSISSVLTAPTNSIVKRRPVVSFSLALNYAVSGLEVWSYHAFNLLVHVLNALLVYGICRRTLLGEVLRARYAGAAPWLAAAVALLWVVHPLQTEAVTYVMQRTELVMAFFLLATLYCVIRGAGAARPWPWYAGAVACSALGMGSKEVMTMAPLLVLLYDRTFLAGSFREALRRRSAVYVGMAATWPIVAVLVATRPSAVVGFGFKDLTPWDYAKTQAGVIVHYLRLAVWPRPLVIDYTGWPVAKSLTAVAPEAAVVLTFLGATALALGRRSPLGFLGAWFFLILAPTSSFLPILTEIAAERRMYLPLAALIVLGVIGTHEGLRRVVRPDGRRRCVEACALAGLLAASCAATLRRNDDYRSEVSILSDLVAKRPENARAHYNLGLLLDQGAQPTRAGAHYAEAVRLDPYLSAARINLGLHLARQGRVDEAIVRYSEGLRFTPDDARLHNNLAVALASLGDREAAERHYLEALRVQPDYTAAQRNLGNLLRDQGRLDEAVERYLAALRSNPNDAGTHYNLGIALARQGRIEDARRGLERALALRPDHQAARHALDHLQSGAIP